MIKLICVLVAILSAAVPCKSFKSSLLSKFSTRIFSTNPWPFKAYAANFKSRALWGMSIDATMQKQPNKERPSILIVGGGPAGLGAALELRSLGWDITVLERAASCTAMDPERAFQYLIDARGQKFTDAHNLTAAIKEIGVSVDQFTVMVCKPGLPRTPRQLRLAGPKRKVSCWIPRNRFVTVLADAVRATANLAAATSGQAIRIMEGWELAALERTSSGPPLRAVLRRAAANGGAVAADGAIREEIVVTPVSFLATREAIARRDCMCSRVGTHFCHIKSVCGVAC